MSSRMFGEKAIELIKEIKRTPDGQIAPYNEGLVRQVLEEMRYLFEENQKEVRATTEGTKGLFTGIQLRHVAMERNQRCLLAYINHRMTYIKRLRWEYGTVLPDEIKQNLNEMELQWFQQYNRLLASYMRSIGLDEGIDLTVFMNPPKGLYIEVRCLVDYGELETEDGTVVQLKKGSIHQLLRSQCEHLIRQGILEHLNS